MNTIKLNTYGSILTGREFGKHVLMSLISKMKYPLAFDFQGVISMGSSFGDEVIPYVAHKQNEEIIIYNANKSIWDVLNEIAEEFNIKFVKGTY